MVRRRLVLPPRDSTLELSTYRDRPVAFVREVLGGDPWERQEQILEALAREPRVTVRSCNGAGKTLCAAWAALWFLMSRPGSIVITTAPTKNQVVNLLWRRLRSAFKGAKVNLPGRCLTAMLELGTDWYAMGMATDEEVNFQGPHSPHGVLMIGDEASGLAEWLFSAMQGSMTEEGAKQLLIGNPNVAGGTFYESHRSWEKSQRFHISAFDVPARVLNPDWTAGMLKELGETSPVYQVRVLGQFPEQGPDALISMRWVQQAQERELIPVGDYEFGVDVSEYGDDESVCYVRRGPVVLHQRTWRNNDPLESAGQVISVYNEVCPGEPAIIKVDDIGIGAGTRAALIAHFAEHRHVVPMGLNVGESAWDSENYANRRSEIFCGLRDRFKDGDIDIPADDTLLMDQLTQLLFAYSAKGQMKLEGKPEIRKRRVGEHRWKSPDRADALALAFAGAERGYMPAAAAGQAREGLRAWR